MSAILSLILSLPHSISFLCGQHYCAWRHSRRAWPPPVHSPWPIVWIRSGFEWKRVRVQTERVGVFRTHADVVRSAAKWWEGRRNLMPMQTWLDCSADCLGHCRPEGTFSSFWTIMTQPLFWDCHPEDCHCGETHRGLCSHFCLVGFTLRTGNDAQFVSVEIQNFLRAWSGTSFCTAVLAASERPRRGGAAEPLTSKGIASCRQRIAVASRSFQVSNCAPSDASQHPWKEPVRAHVWQADENKAASTPTAVHDDGVRDADWSRKLKGEEMEQCSARSLWSFSRNWATHAPRHPHSTHSALYYIHTCVSLSLHFFASTQPTRVALFGVLGLGACFQQKVRILQQQRQQLSVGAPEWTFGRRNAGRVTAYTATSTQTSNLSPSGLSILSSRRTLVNTLMISVCE